MKRREILQRRRYAACPKATLARADLTASAKVVYTCLIGELFSDAADTTELSTNDIAAKSGLAQRTVRGALRDLEAAELIASHHQSGRATVYTFPTTDTGAEPRQNLPTPPAESAGVTPPDPGENCLPPRQNPPGTPAESAGPYKELNVLERSLNSPLPPNGERDDGAGPNQTKTKTKTKDRAVAIANLAAAYLDATGRAMPAAWSAAAGREFDNGDRPIFAEIDAAAIRRGQAFAEKRNLAFAFRTLVLAIHQRPLIDPVAIANASRAEQGEALAETMSQLEADRDEQQAVRTAAAVAYFHSEALDEPTRQRWRAIIAAMPGVDRCGPDAMETLAALRAFSHKETNRPCDYPQRKRHA